MRRVIVALLCVMATLWIAHRSSYAQAGCTSQTQAANLNALRDGQAAGSITPQVLRNVVCSTGNSQITSDGSTTARTLSARSADVINIRDYGALGNTVGYIDGTISASGSSLSSSNATFSPSDVGKSIILHGSGSAGGAQQGTITGFTDTHHISVSFTATGATPWSGTWSAVVASGGSGYTNGDTLTVLGGTCTTQPTFTQTGTGAASGLAVANPGQCLVLPSSPASTSGGTGTGATLTLTPWQMGGQFSYGTDDTSGFVAASVAAASAGKCLYISDGSYWLVSQTSSISAKGLCIRGEGEATSAYPFTGAGSVVLISDTATPAFSGLGNSRISGITFYYPAQDGSGAAPIVFPALFDVTTGSNNNNWFDHIRVVNAYQFIHTGVSGGIGRTYIDNSLIYAIDKAFYLQNGFADVVMLGNNMFGPNAFANQATSGPAMLGNYTLSSGTLVYSDISGGAYTLMDGLILNGNYVIGYRYGVRLSSGTMDVSSISGTDWDSVGTVLEVDNAAAIVSTQWSGGFIYSTNTSLLSQNAPVFYFNTTSGNHNSDFSITGVHVAFALGPVVKDQTGSLRTFEFAGNTAKAFGRSTTSATYYAFQQPGGGATVSFTGNSIDCSGSGNTVSGLLLSQATSVTAKITDNTFVGCGNNIVNQGSAGTEIVSGNISSGTVGATINDISTGTSLLVHGANQWDKVPALRAPSISSCGTAATIGTNSSNERGVINVGTGGVTACTLSFTTPLPYAPIAVLLSTDNTGVTPKVTSVSATNFVAGLSADLSGGHIYYQAVR